MQHFVLRTSACEAVSNPRQEIALRRRTSHAVPCILAYKLIVIPHSGVVVARIARGDCAVLIYIVK